VIRLKFETHAVMSWCEWGNWNNIQCRGFQGFLGRKLLLNYKIRVKISIQKANQQQSCSMQETFGSDAPSIELTQSLKSFGSDCFLDFHNCDRQIFCASGREF
jgi:hypothetical protein